jgi:hypothetical protein
MLRTYAGDTFCRVCQVNECLVNEELCSCIFMLPDLFQNCIPWQKGSGRVIGIADELRHAFILPDNRDATSAIDRGSIFPKGMRGDGDRIARIQGGKTKRTDNFHRSVSYTDFIRPTILDTRNMFLKNGITIVWIGRYRNFAGIPGK